MKNIVYHGSPKGDLDIIKPHTSSHQKEVIYATDNKVVAMLYMGRENGDLDTRVSSIDGKPEVVERRRGVLDRLYNKEGYIYELDGSTFNHYDYLWKLEVISFEKELKPLNKIYYSNILDALRKEAKEGNLILYEYPDRPEVMPGDNSDLIEKYVSSEKKGNKGAIERLLKIYPEFKDRVDKIEK